MASNDILQSKLSEVETLLTYLKKAVTDVNDKDKDNEVTDGETESDTAPPPAGVTESSD